MFSNYKNKSFLEERNFPMCKSYVVLKFSKFIANRMYFGRIYLNINCLKIY